MKFFFRTVEMKTVWILLVLCVIFILLRFPSLFEPNWYGDEAIYQVIGNVLTHGGLLYRDIWDNKPPLLYILYALVQGDQFMIRFVSLIFGLITVPVIFRLSCKVFNSMSVAYTSTAIFVILFGLPIIEGNIANAENFMLLPSLAAGYIFYVLTENKRQSRSFYLLFCAGLLSGFSLLFKVFGLFDFIAFICFIVFLRYTSFTRKHMVGILLQLLPAFIGLILPLFLSGIYFVYHHAFFYFFDAILSGNIQYVNWRNSFFIPQGLLILKVCLLFVFIASLFLKRRFFTKAELFILLWTGFSLFSAFLSQRPYTHYQLVLLPAVSLSVGLVVAQRDQVRKIVTAVLLGIIVIISYKSFTHWDFLRTIRYYDNFIHFVRGGKSITEYQSFFDGNTPRDYLLADYIRLHTEPNQMIFVWGNNPEVYVLSQTLPPGRYTVQYHISKDKATLAETADAIRKRSPKYIIIMPGLPSIPFDMHPYVYQKTINGTQIYAHLP